MGRTTRTRNFITGSAAALLALVAVMGIAYARPPTSSIVARRSRASSGLRVIARIRTPIAFIVAAAMTVTLAGTANASPIGKAPTVIRGAWSYTADWYWLPATTRISAGDHIKWLADIGDHVIVAYGHRWHFFHRLPRGSSVTHPFPTAGTYRFRCQIHSRIVDGNCWGMCGKIVVR